MTFNTGKPVPSTDPRDLYDNAENLDKLVNGADPFYADRLGKLRESWSGMENSFNNAQEGRETAFTLSQADKESRFNALMESSAYVSKGAYAADVVLEAYNEYVAVDAATTGADAAFYRPGPNATLPLTLSGDWVTDEPLLRLLGDDVLRQEIAGGSFVTAEMVSYVPSGSTTSRTAEAKFRDSIDFADYIADPLADNREVLQAALDALPAGSVVRVRRTKISEALYIDKPLTLVFNGYDSEIEQTTWGKPCLYIYQADDVTLEGDARFSYRGVRSNIRNAALPTSTDPRLNSAYQAVGEGPGNARGLAAGVYVRFRCDNFRAKRIHVYGQVVGLIHATANVYADYCENNVVDELSVDTVDFGYLSGGFKQFSIGRVVAKNITTTQDDPTHAVYVGPRTTRNGQLYIGSIEVDGCHHIADASDAIRASDAFSIRDTELVTVGSVQIRNAQYIGNFQGCRAIVGSINAVLDAVTSGTVAGEEAVLFPIQGAGDVTVNYWRVETALGWSAGKVAAYITNVSGQSKLTIADGLTKMTAASPAQVGRLSSSGLMIKARMDIEYASDFDASYPERAVWSSGSSQVSNKFELIDPSLTGTSRLFNALIANQNWRIYLNPARIASLTENTIIDASGTYNVNFTSQPSAPPVATAWTGTGAVVLRGRNVMTVNNASSASLAACNSGATPGQEYMLLCTDTVTTITHSATLVTKGAANIAAGWKWFKFVVVGSVAYEIAHGR